MLNISCNHPVTMENPAVSTCYAKPDADMTSPFKKRKILSDFTETHLHVCFFFYLARNLGLQSFKLHFTVHLHEAPS